MDATKLNKAAKKKLHKLPDLPLFNVTFTGSRLEVPASTRGEKAHEATSNALLGGSLTHNRHNSSEVGGRMLETMNLCLSKVICEGEVGRCTKLYTRPSL